MTRKDFIAIAEAVRDTRHPSTPATNHICDTVARKLADRLAGTNERFNRSRFLAACGVE